MTIHLDLEAYRESDERAKFKLMYKLASYFEEEILEEIQFKTILVEEKAEKEFEIYRKREMELLESDFDREIKRLKNKNDNSSN